MKSKYALILFATSFAIVLTTLTYVDTTYKELWLALEIIILPIIYIIGYEMLMDNQRKSFLKTFQHLKRKLTRIDKQKQELDEVIERIKYS